MRACAVLELCWSILSEHLLLTSSCLFFTMGLAGSSPQRASVSVPPSKPHGWFSSKRSWMPALPGR